jgi:quercetin dioxygenase-like cupin family protein
MLAKRGGFLNIELAGGHLYEHSDRNFTTLVAGFTPDCQLELAAEQTHFGIVIKGEIELKYLNRIRPLIAGDFFSVVGRAVILSTTGVGMITSACRYNGLNISGGPIEDIGRLRYIDGCTDTLLVPPVRKGDACLNHLHFPAGVTQTPHTHPSIRVGIVYRGRGECIIPVANKPLPLTPGYIFVIETEAVHSFNTRDEAMDIIAFHPDSDTGMTDDDHPMINRTIVEGVSARDLDAIKTAIPLNM